MRARMLSPRCNCSLCFGVYAGDDFSGELRLRVDVLALPAFLIPLLQARHGGMTSRSLPLPPDIWYLLTSVRAWRTKRYPSEGISFLKR